MRLSCPNCGAQYEVPDDVIPTEGRDVQCSNCGDTWFQAHPDHAPSEPDASTQLDADEHQIEQPSPDDQEEHEARPEPQADANADAEPLVEEEEPESAPEPQDADPVSAEDEAQPEAEQEPEPDTAPSETYYDDPDDYEEEYEAEQPEPSVSPETLQRRELDPSVADILKQEAELEIQARAHEGEGLESQPDLGLEEADDEASRRAREARTRMARIRGENPEAEAVTDEALAATALGSRRDLLPDIEEINSTLRSTSERQASGEDAVETAPQRHKRKRGFRRGFVLMILLAILLIALYIMAPRITAMAPAADPLMTSYVSTVDSGRSWLDQKVLSALKWLDDTASNSSPSN